MLPLPTPATPEDSVEREPPNSEDARTPAVAEPGQQPPALHGSLDSFPDTALIPPTSMDLPPHADQDDDDQALD